MLLNVSVKAKRVKWYVRIGWTGPQCDRPPDLEQKEIGM